MFGISQGHVIIIMSSYKFDILNDSCKLYFPTSSLSHFVSEIINNIEKLYTDFRLSLPGFFEKHGFLIVYTNVMLQSLLMSHSFKET